MIGAQAIDVAPRRHYPVRGRIAARAPSFCSLPPCTHGRCRANGGGPPCAR
jgi:hypothetical protein